ncbi:acyl carrier protein [Nocardia sp. NPDC056952]|uniref:acyl carrier protein n=1 Tax=Nocardia sp. NPDC056952 TaxID=3345979 RepID=UPI00362F308C
MSDERTVIVAAITDILARRGAGADELATEAKLGAELGFNSLEFAELSAQLEDNFGHDPYSTGLFPDTVNDIIEYYEQASAPQVG